MDKDIVLLACSKKHNNYCVAGIDIRNGEWVRIVSDDQVISEAVRADDMRFEDGALPQLLNIVRVPVLGRRPNYYQPENYILDDRHYWSRIGVANAVEVAKNYTTNRPEYLFYNTAKSIESNYIQGLREDEKFSLIALIPENLQVQVKHWPEGKKVDVSFIYNGRWYRYLKVTDPEFLHEFLGREEGNYFLRENIMLVVSLGENYYGAHYKLVSGVIRF